MTGPIRRAAGRSGVLSAVLVLLVGGCADRADRSPGPAAAPGPDATLRSLLDEAEAVFRDGSYDAALSRFDEVRQAALGQGDSIAAAVATTWMGQAHYWLGNYGESRRLGEEALVWKQRLGLNDELAQSFNALGLVAWNEGRLRDAVDLHERSLGAARAVGDSTGVARSFANLALVLTDLGELTRAAEYHRDSREAFAALGRPELEGRVLTNLGALHMEWGDPVRAEQALEEAFERYAEAGDPTGELNALGQLGVVRAAQGDPERGLQLLDSALARARELEMPWEEASNLEQLANIHAALGSTRLALDLYSQANAIHEDLGLVYERGANLRAQASLHREQGNAALGLALLTEALAAHREIGAGGEVLADLLELALMARSGGRPDEVDAHLAEAEEWAAALASPRAAIAVALTRASLAGDDGRWADALSALAGVESRLPDAPADLRWEAELLRARALEGIGDPGAVGAAEAAVELVEQLRSSLTADLLRGSVARDRAETYHLLVRLFLAEGRVDDAFEAAEASRSRAVARRIATAGLSGGGSDDSGPNAAALEEALVRLQHLEGVLEELYAWTPASDRDGAFETQVRELRAERDGARRELTRRIAQQGSAAVPSEAAWASGQVDADALRSRLAPDEAFLSFLETDEGLVVFTVRHDGIDHRLAAVAREELTSRVRVARALVGGTTAPSEALGRVLSEWHELLIAPLERGGTLDGVEHLIVTADGPLAYLPLAALQDTSSGRFLVERYSLQDIPSAAALVALRSGQSRSLRGPGLGAGFAPEPEGLPASTSEVERFASAFPGETHVGPNATEGRMRDALATGAVVHAAAHGRMNARNPLFSSVELAAGPGGSAEDGLLHVHEMLDLAVDAPLVFLSGCETGAASSWAPGVLGGRDLSTLAEALLYAGAGAVVATLWPIQDHPAAEFAGHFYEALEAAGPAGALAEAQRRMLSDPDTRSPFYWAGYRVSGEG